MKRTSLQELLQQDNTCNKKENAIEWGNCSIEELNEKIWVEDEKLKIYNALYDKDPSAASAFVFQLINFYRSSNSSEYFDILKDIISGKNCDPFARLESCNTFSEMNVPAAEYFILSLQLWIEDDPKQRAPSNVFISSLEWLIKNYNNFTEEQQEKIKYYGMLFVDLPYNAKFIFTNIKSFDTVLDPDPKFIILLWKKFIENCKEHTYTVLACQRILLRDNKEHTAIMKLFQFGRDVSLSENERADALDTILRCADESYYDSAREIISTIGGSKNIYRNSQNVHNAHIEKAVAAICLQLAAIPIPKRDGKEMTFDNTLEEFERELERELKNKEKKDEKDIRKSIQNSMLRIRLDSALYPGNQTLQTIWLKIWDKISTHSQRDFLFSRLQEELIEMDRTCSSGHVSRLINVFSGVEWNLDIGYKQQITANLSGRIEARIRKINDNETITVSKVVEKDAKESKQGEIDRKVIKVTYNLKEKLMDELTATESEDRMIWNAWFIAQSKEIETELYKEYVDVGLMSADDFSTSFREAVSYYETGITVV